MTEKQLCCLNELGLKSWLVFFILLLSFGPANAALDVDNGVLGTPEVECERDFVNFKVATKKPFRGRVYVKGEFDNPKCVQSVLEATGTHGEESENGHGSSSSSKGTEETHFGDEPTLDKGSSRRGGETSAGGTDFEAAEVEAKPSKGSGGRKPASSVPGVPEGEEEEADAQRHQQASAAEEGDDEEETIRQILQELQKRRSGNQDKAQRPIPSHLPGFASAEQLKRWRSFLGGKLGLDGQGFRRYGSKLSPDANGECPLVCPPCEDCGKGSTRNEVLKRKRRLADHHAELRVPLGECRTVQRDRMANPPGMQLSLTVVVSFHPNFISFQAKATIDRAYNIQCAYQEPERILSTQIDVSPPPIIQISNEMPTPQCEYRIHGQTTADQVRNVRVGDTVEHEWSCHGVGQAAAQQEQQEQRMAGLFGLLVHDCFVDDGKSRRAQVVDSRGCSLDPLILPTPIYTENALRATVLSAVAKFPDGDLIGFQCSITVCMRELGRCDGITPPDCSDSAALNSDPFAAVEVNRTREKRATEEAEALDWQLNSPLMTVFDLSDQVEGAQEAFGHHQQQPVIQRPLARQQAPFCVSVSMFAALVSLGTFLSTVSTGALIVTLLFRGGFSAFLEKE